MNRTIVRAQGVSKTYSGGRIIALQDIEMAVERGEFVAILGPSGSGKTTLLNLLGALDRPTTGRVIVDGVDLAGVKKLEHFRAEKIGFIFQLYNLIPTLNAWENVQLPMYVSGLNSRERQAKAMELLEAVGLKDRANHTPAMLSGGERQRVAIARALANNPCVVLGDEPTGTLEPEKGAEIIELMRGLNQAHGTTFILVTHDPNVARVAQRVIHLVDGKVVAKE